MSQGLYINGKLFFSLFSLAYVLTVVVAFAFLKQARRAQAIHRARGGACLVLCAFPELRNYAKKCLLKGDYC